MGNHSSKEAQPPLEIVHTGTGEYINNEAKEKRIKLQNELQEEYNNFPPLDTFDVDKKYFGWWSATGKPEPDDMEAKLALHLQENGNYFFRTTTGSVRGTFFYGQWRPVENSNNEILLFNEEVNNLRQCKIDYFKCTAIIQDNSDIEIEFKDNKIVIPRVVSEKSSQKSARSAK